MSKDVACDCDADAFGAAELLEVIDCVPHPDADGSNYVCGKCWNKLNKLSKLEHDIKTKLESLKADRLELIRTLRQKNQGDFSLHQPRMWTPKSKKHNINHSPTPRKVKQLFVPSSQSDLTGSKTISNSQASCSKKTPEHRKRRKKEPKFSCFPTVKSRLYLEIISGVFDDQKYEAVAVISAIIQKNMHMSAFHHAVSQVLDNGGATDECINLLNKLGLCVSSSAAAKKKTDFISEKIVLEQNTGDDKVLSDKIGDNRSPSHMSKDKQRQSWHWFLLHQNNSDCYGYIFFNWEVSDAFLT
uniref:ZAD domain-containing protein n=1 Tax=Magallana gigas TaxID=29159 RepID=A0A8W8P6C9_MAGGI